jgi:hypothetical protein
VQSWAVLPNNNYTALVQAVATIGPLAINADASNWSAYSSGVFTGCTFDNIGLSVCLSALSASISMPPPRSSPCALPCPALLCYLAVLCFVCCIIVTDINHVIQLASASLCLSPALP